MKKPISILKITLILCFGFGSFNSQAQCIDTSLIDSTAFCTTIYAPVCGCDGKTYSNSCVAEKLGGVTTYKSGPCAAASCSADFNMIIDSSSPCKVYFTDKSTSSGSLIVGWYWTFGDGGTSTVKNPIHTYSGMGPYTVKLTITLADSTTCDYTRSITLAGCRGSSSGCKVSASFTSSVSGLTVSCTSTSSGSGTIVSYAWTFGDGGTASTASPSHTYSTGGTYTICLTVTAVDSAGDTCTDKICTPHTVSGPSPDTCDADFGYYPDSADDCIMHFYSTSTSTSLITTYSWSFGDGGTITGNPRSHTYATTGYYYVCLTITDSLGCTSTKCDTVFVRCDTSTSSIAEVLDINRLRVLPNPVLDRNITLELALYKAEEVSIEVISLQGQDNETIRYRES